MRKLLMIAAVALLPFTAQAQFSLGLRVGYAPAMGDAEKDAALSDLVSSQIPVQVDAMYKVMPDLSVGAYFSYGIAQVDLGGVCDIDGVDCSGSSMRLGLQAAYAFSKVSPTFLPWVGAGFGYEWASTDVDAGGYSGNYKVDGFEFLNLQAGADYKVNEKFSVGPYLQFSLGQYSNYETEEPMFDPITDEYLGQATSSGSIEEKAIHEWFGFGVRGKFDL